MLQTIAATTLRLGLVTRDARGFDLTKWHHLRCLPLNSNAVTSTDSIKGFSALKSSDQEELKKLMKDSSQSYEKVSGADDVGSTDQGESKAKKPKLSTTAEGGELEIVISASDIKDNYKGATLLPQWRAFQTVIFLEKADGLHDSTKIAAFDFDGCLAKTSVKKVGADAWSLMYPSIPEKLQGYIIMATSWSGSFSFFTLLTSLMHGHSYPSIPEKLQGLYNDGYKLVIFTNESNIERWKNKRQAAVDSKIGRLESFIKLVNVPIQVFITCGLSYGQPEDAFRKPKIGLWRTMEKNFNSGLQIDMDNSFYVGDAAGRADDHSDADIKFAEAIGLKFYAPEEYFVS